MIARVELREGWQLAATPAGACGHPDALAALAPAWNEARVPGTVASALHGDLAAARDYDAEDWWYRCTFAAPAGAAGRRHFLRFDGLATLAQVWLNGEPVLASRNMFVGHRVDVTRRLRDVNQLVIRFASLRAALGAKRARPRWKTALVEEQGLRWFRTTLLGRMPGWTPMIPAVGPWEPVSLESAASIDLRALDLQFRAEGSRGRVHIRAAIASLDGEPVVEARLRLGGALHALPLLQGDEARIHADLDVGEVPLWWPHTHGEPRRVPWALEVRTAGGWIEADRGLAGFRDIALDRAGGALRFVVNGVPVFCRGACWSTQDALSLRGPREALRASLELARGAGANMLRVGGTMAYESDAFYELCDELGILVWQDFMFANMDYPVADAAFLAEARAEAEHQLGRLQRHACIAAYCGSSEVAQQAAMRGVPAEHWTNELFSRLLPDLCASRHAGVPYFPSTPWGGALPFHVGTGLAHYYGVGAYLRPVSDVKAARVKFATECLAFSQVPEPGTTAMVTGQALPPPHDPRWKARVPRDMGAGWDFEDVRDHYLRSLFGVDPVALRSRDLERYYALSRQVPGEVMRRVFAEWRAPASACGGALVWLYRDLWPGAGWGVVDSTGCPKPAWWHLRRAWAPRALHLTDEGLDGLAIHVVNDGAEALEGSVELALFRDARTTTAVARAAVQVPARGAVTLQADALLGHFTDSTNAYRFGPLANDLVVARLALAGGTVISEDFHFPAGMAPTPREPRVRIETEAIDADHVRVRIESDTLLQGVSVSSEGFVPSDNHFHVAPQRGKTLLFARAGAKRASDGAFEARFEALNIAAPLVARPGAPSGAANEADGAGSNLFVARNSGPQPGVNP